MPFKRILGNVSLSILTCICAWNFRVFDTQDGYTAISKKDNLKTAAAYHTEVEFFEDMAHDMMLEKEWQKVADRIIK